MKRDEVCAVITTFLPDEKFPERVEKVKAQVGRVIIIDDGNTEQNKCLLKTWFSDENITVFHNPENLGIASALNNGVKIAKQYGFDWVLLLDDDSVVNANMVERLMWYFNHIGKKEKIGVIGLSWSEIKSYDPKEIEQRWAYKRGIITSGSLVPMKAYDEAGGFRDEFFIDSVDYDFCLRLRKLGYKIIKVDEVGFYHKLGDLKSKKVIFREVNYRTHNIQREYYHARNAMVLSKEYFLSDSLYSAVVLWGLLKRFLEIFVLEENKLSRLNVFIKGIWHGIINKLGKYIVRQND